MAKKNIQKGKTKPPRTSKGEGGQNMSKIKPPRTKVTKNDKG